MHSGNISTIQVALCLSLIALSTLPEQRAFPVIPTDTLSAPLGPAPSLRFTEAEVRVQQVMLYIYMHHQGTFPAATCG